MINPLVAGDLPTVEGHNLVVAGTPPAVTVNGANIVAANIVASNGVINGIDKVLVVPVP